MNTPTLIFLILGVFIYGFGFYIAVKNYLKEDDPSIKKVNLFVIGILIFVALFMTVVSLNTYGYLRLPLFNQVTRTMPDDYTPNIGLAKPPSAGLIQPPSQPAIDTHKEQMDRLKREGL